jgi:hypothetical protein
MRKIEPNAMPLALKHSYAQHEETADAAAEK